MNKIINSQYSLPFGGGLGRGASRFSILLVLLITTSWGWAQEPILDGYYTIGALAQEKDGYLYSYDTDALRSVYGNAVDYKNPYGKNGEHAYFYSITTTSANLTNRAYYLTANPDGSYTIQSCSGEPYSYLDVARYDRHLVIHSARPGRRFFLRQEEDTSEWPEDHYIMQQFQKAALFDSLAARAHGLAALQVLTLLDEDKVTPSIRIRRTLGHARGALALYPSGDNPGQVTPLLNSSLRECIDEALALADDKNITSEQADEIILRLQQATQAYEETAPTAINPLVEGYYWLNSAYRAFVLRQNKQKVMRIQETDGQPALRWNNASVNDGSTAFYLSPKGENVIMKDYMDRWSSRQLFRYDTEGLFTIADADAPDNLLTADDSWIGEKGLYGKPSDGPVTARSDSYLYPGYCASWFLQRAYHQVTVPTAGWAVLSASFPAEVPEGVEVFSVMEKDGVIYMEPYENNVIPARTAVVLHAAKGTYTFWSTAQEVPAIEGNALVPVCEDRKDVEAGSMALLKVKNGVVGFQKSTSKQISAGSAYIPYSEGQEEFRQLQESETGINMDFKIQNSKFKIADAQSLYDISGRKVSEAHKGVIIVNNKKMLKR